MYSRVHAGYYQHTPPLHYVTTHDRAGEVRTALPGAYILVSPHLLAKQLRVTQEAVIMTMLRLIG